MAKSKAKSSQAAARRAGAMWEATLTKFFRHVLGLTTEHVRNTGRHDEGDHAVEDDETDRIFLVEAKNAKSWDISGWVAQAEVEARNYARSRGVDPARLVPVVVIKRRNHGVREAYVVTTVRHFFG